MPTDRRKAASPRSSSRRGWCNRDEAGREILRRLGEELTADRVVVEIVVVPLGARTGADADIHEAVARTLGHEQAAGQHVVDDRGVDRDRAAEGAVIAAGEFRHGVESVKVRRSRDDVDDPGGRVLAEQRALRAFQHFDTLEFAEVAEADAVAGAVDAVDVHQHRGFKADVVAHRANAANTRRGGGFAARRRDREAGGQYLQVLDVVDSGVLQELLANRGDDHRHILQIFLALRCGDDDDVAPLAGL